MMGGSSLITIFVWTLVTSSIGTRALPSMLSIWEGQSDIDILSLAISDAEGETWSLIDTPRLHIHTRPAFTEGEGWLSRWLSVGGEGVMDVVIDSNRNLTFAHRPSSFPASLTPKLSFPISGLLVPFTTLLNDSKHYTEAGTDHSLMGPIHSGPSAHPEYACFPSALPRGYEFPPTPWKIALIERGDCDFAMKVRAAQVLGAAGVVVGDGKLREDETDDVGRKRESLITMFSPEDTDSIFIPSVFVSRASYLSLRDLLADGTRSTGHPGLWVTLGPGADEGATLSSLLSFALLMPTLFLLVTIAAHRVRMTRQREAERAPPLLVLSLPERIWTPDIVWEKDSDSDTDSFHTATSSPSAVARRSDQETSTQIPPPPLITSSEVPTPPMLEADNQPIASSSKTKKRSKSGLGSSGMRYFSKDECAICMDSFQRGEVVRILPCGHVFHKDECDEWLLKWRKLCPTCRADVTLPPGEVAAGAAITPVSSLDDVDVEEQEQSFRERIVHRFRTRWHDLMVRRSGRVEHPAETTPLVRQPSERRHDEGDV